MDVNSRINWAPGMELTSDTFKELDDNLHLRRILSFRVSSGNQYGVLPDTEFHADGVFSKGCFEVERLECTAILPSGEIINVNEPFSVPLKSLQPGEYLLCVGLGEKNVTFEKNNVQYIRPEYISVILGKEDIDGKDLMPVAKFIVKDGVCNVDRDYLPPCFTIKGSARIQEFRQKAETLLRGIIEHANMPEGDGKATLIRCLYRLKALKEGADIEAVISLAEKMSGAADYFIVRKYEGEKAARPLVERYDIVSGLAAVESYLELAVKVLDETPLEDDSIDYDKLKAEITSELHSKLVPELTESLKATLLETLNGSIEEKLSAALKDYLDGTFRAQLEESLKLTLSEELRTSLYESLYKALYDALYVKEEVVENVYIPNI